jgi:hypothetical protein
MGIVLEELESSDMIDVLHFMFEEDALGPSGEYLEARSSLRTSIYSNLYKEEYNYKVGSKGSGNFSPGDYNSSMANGEDLVPFDPMNAATKPYVPTTDFDPNSSLPFGGLIEAPEA